MKDREIPITASILRDYCWACSINNVPLEGHHVVPVHLGGSNGPLVNICGGCHQLTHNLANLGIAGKPWNVPNTFKGNFGRLSYLATVIIRAAKAVEGQQGKKWKYSRVWSDEQHTKLLKLAKIYMSQDKALDAALNALYVKHFEK